MIPVSSASGRNSAGSSMPRSRMAPADQRLDPDQRAGGAIDLRLIADLQLALGQRQAQLGLGLAAQPQLPVHAGLEEAEAVPAAVLGPIQRHVGALQQLRLVMPVGRQPPRRRC